MKQGPLTVSKFTIPARISHSNLHMLPPANMRSTVAQLGTKDTVRLETIKLDSANETLSKELSS